MISSKYREAKEPQAGPHIPVSELFRLRDRTIVNTSSPVSRPAGVHY